MRCYSKLIRIVIGALSLERTYRMQVITFLTPYSPAPCANIAQNTGHQTLFLRFGRVWERDYVHELSNRGFMNLDIIVQVKIADLKFTVTHCSRCRVDVRAAPQRVRVRANSNLDFIKVRSH